MNAIALGSHLLPSHKFSSKDYYDKFMAKDSEGICHTCGNQTKFIDIGRGYRKYCSLKCFGTDPEIRDIVCKRQKERYSDPMQREKTSQFGIERFKDPKQRIIASQAGIKRYKDPKQRELTSISTKQACVDHPEKAKAHSEKMKEYWQNSEYVKNQMEARSKQTFPFSNTSIEVKIQSILKDNNIEFETQKSIVGIPDIFIAPNICIFADGDYFHASPFIYKPDSKAANGMLAKQIWDKDEKVTKKLEAQGYIALRFWEHEINDNIISVKNKILETTKCLNESRLQPFRQHRLGGML